MVRLFKVKDFEARRRALAAESEIYRQALTLEIQNVRLYTARLRNKLNPVVHSAPAIKLLMPLVTGWLARKRRGGKWSRLIGLSLGGWQAYRRFGPAIRSLLWSRTRTKGHGSAVDGTRTPAANS